MNLDERINLLKSAIELNDQILCNMKTLKQIIPLLTEGDKELEKVELTLNNKRKLEYINQLNIKIYEQVTEIQEVTPNE